MTVYIRLLDEGSEAARPTDGELVADGVFRVLPRPTCDPEDEHWEFPPRQQNIRINRGHASDRG